MTFVYIGIFYGNNIRAVLDNKRSINLGSVYENAVASELYAHGHKLFYYDNRDKGDVDYLIDDYHVKKAYVLSNESEIRTSGKIIYLPVYYVMFFKNGTKISVTV